MANFIAPGQGGYNGPRMAAAPIVTKSADSFGAESGRNLKEAGRLGLSAGLDILAAAQKQQKICDTAVARDAVNQASIEMLDGTQRIMAEKGANAQNAEAEYDALYSRIDRKTASIANGGNIERQRMISQSMQSLDRQNRLAIARHQVRQEIEYEKNTLEIQNNVLSRQMVEISRGKSPLAGDGTDEVLEDKQGRVLPPINPGENLSAFMNQGRANIAAFLAGHPQGYINQAQDDWEVAQWIQNIEAMAENNPSAAFELLNMPKVREIIPPKAWLKTNDWLKGVVEMADVSEDAEKSLAELGPQKALIKAYSGPRYQTDPDALKQYVSIVTNLNTQNDNLAKAEQAGLMEKYFDELRETGKIPLEATKDIETFKAMTSLKATWDSFIKENPVPDMDWIENFDNMTQAQRDESMSTAKGHAEFDHKTAGDAGWKEFFEKKRQGSTDKAGVYGGMNLSEQIEANFPALAYSTTEKGWLPEWVPGASLLDSETAVGGVEYDGSLPEHKRIKSNFMHHFRNRWNDAELYKDAAPNERAENILFDIIGEYREQKIALDSPLYDAEMATRLQDQIDNPVVEYVNPDTGKTEVTIGNSKEGTVQNFEKLDVEEFQSIPGMKNVSEAFRAPESMPGGRYKGVEYQPGDSILTVTDKLHKMADSIIVLDKDLNPRWDQVSIGGYAKPESAENAAEQPEVAEPPKTSQMEAWEKKYGAQFEWQDYNGWFVAKTKDVNDPMQDAYYIAYPDGTISYIGAHPEGYIDEDEEELNVSQ